LKAREVHTFSFAAGAENQAGREAVPRSDQLTDRSATLSMSGGGARLSDRPARTVDLEPGGEFTPYLIGLTWLVTGPASTFLRLLHFALLE
jgi:hypothetical protein